MNPIDRNSKCRREVLLFAFALALRLVAVQLLWTPSEESRTYEHGEIARNLVDGRGFRVEFLGLDRFTSQQAPFYPYLLAGSYLTFGIDSPHAELALQVVQCFAGALLCLGVVALSRAVLPNSPATAWCAGLGAALYPPHVYMVTHLQVALWAALWLTWLAALTLGANPLRTWRTGAASGILAALVLLTEPILALALPILALALWRRTYVATAATATRRFLASTRPTIAMTAMTCIVIAPWIARNYLVHGEFVFIKDTFGYAYWQGNNDVSYGTDKVPMPDAMKSAKQHDGSLSGVNQALWAARFETMYIDDLLLTREDDALFLTLSEPACCRELGARADAFIAAHPDRYAALCLNRLQFFLFFDLTNPKALHPIYQCSSLAWLTLAAIGLIVSRSDWRTLWPTYAIFLAILTFHTLTITSARFRIPVEPLTFPWCAAAVVSTASCFRKSTKEKP